MLMTSVGYKSVHEAIKHYGWAKIKDKIDSLKVYIENNFISKKKVLVEKAIGKLGSSFNIKD